MKQPNPPFLQLSSYFPDMREPDALARLVTALLGMGAKFTGVGAAHRGVGVRDRPFASITDELLEPVALANVNALKQHLADPDTRLIQVHMEGATDIVQEVAEIISFESISQEAAAADRHPLCIFTEGWLFSGTIRKEFARRTREAGRRAYERLLALAEALKPAYAAITVEHPLECPTDLRRDPRSLAFRDFYVNGAYVGTKNLTLIRDLFAEASIRHAAGGLYVSCAAEFNPEGKSLDVEHAQTQSMEVAKLIASVARI